MIRLLTVTSLVLGLGLEILILQRVFDPQGDWRGSEYADIRYYGVMASLPYLAAFAWFVVSLIAKKQLKTVFTYSSYMAVAGVVLAFISLRQGAHTAAGLLPIGFFLQWFILGIALIRALRDRLGKGTRDSEETNRHAT